MCESPRTRLATVGRRSGARLVPRRPKEGPSYALTYRPVFCGHLFGERTLVFEYQSVLFNFQQPFPIIIILSL